MRSGKYLALAALAAAMLPGVAEAHNFKTGTAIPQAIDAIGAALNDPVLLLTLIPLGLLASIWRAEGLLEVWGPAAIGLIAAIPLSNVASPWFAVPSLLAGIACAILAIIAHDYRPVLVKGLAFVTALLGMLAVLEGHGFMTLPVSIYIGLFLGATAAFVLAAAIARIMIEKLPAVIARIAARILSSWTAAIALMLLAFQVQKLMAGG